MKSPSPKEVALREVTKRTITKEEAKIEYVEWIEENINPLYPKDVIDFWEEVKKEVEQL